MVFSNLIVSLIYTQITITISGSSSTIDDALILDSEGNLYGSNYDGSAVFKITPDGEESIFSDGYVSPNGLAFDAEGFLYIADNQGNKIYKVSPDGEKETFIPSFPSPSGLLFEHDSDTLIATGYTSNKLVKIAPDGEMVDMPGFTGINGPVGLCYDDEFNLYVGNFNDRKIFKITPDGSVSFFAQLPTGVRLGFVIYTNGYFYGTAFQSHKIYRIDLEGNVELFLGSGAGMVDGNADEVRFNGPNGILPTSTGDTIYISDYYTKKVRMITDVNSTLTSNYSLQEMNSSLSIAPNPMSLESHIGFNLTNAGQVSLRLLDINGKVVHEIINTIKLEAGDHEFRLNNPGLPAGTYLVQLEWNQEAMLMKKLVITN